MKLAVRTRRKKKRRGLKAMAAVIVIQSAGALSAQPGGFPERGDSRIRGDWKKGIMH